MHKRLFAVLLAVCFATAAVAEDNASVNAAREVLNSHQDAVISVSAVLKMQMTGMGAQFGHGQEQKVEALGTVIDSSGLTVVSLTMLDPMSMMTKVMSGMGAGARLNFEMKTQFSDVKMRLADGTELPARLVLKDPDLDLAFVLPAENTGQEAATFKNIQLVEGPEMKPLDEVIWLSRLGQSLDREPSIGFARLSAVVKKPRTFYVVGGMPVMGLGTPIFNAEGKILGISLMRHGSMEGGLGAMMSGSFISPVVLPAQDVMEIAQQALEKSKVP